jgi:acetyl esterase/lipase
VLKKAAAFAAVAAAPLAIRGFLGLREALSAVDPELRSPGMLALAVPFNRLTLPFVRLGYRFSSSPGEGVTQTTHHVEDGVRVLVFSPTEGPAPRPAVLWIHGGGMCVGTPQIEAVLSAGMAREIGACVVSPAYRLAPEHPFPAALDDCMTTLKWMTEHAAGLGIDADRIAVHGVSAGGGLAAAIAQRAFDEGIAVRVQAIAYSMLDDRTALNDDHGGRGELTWSSSSNRFAWTAYLGRVPRMSDAPEYAAPARRTDVHGLPPAWIGVGEQDLFYDENVAYAERLKAAGVPCELVTVPGMYHGADHIAPKALSMQRFHASMKDFLRTYLDAAAIST